MDKLNGKASERFGAEERRLPERLAEKLAAIKEAALARKAALAKKEAAKEGAEERRLPERLADKLAPIKEAASAKRAALAKQEAAEEGPHTFFSRCIGLEKRAALLRSISAVSVVRGREEPEVTFEFEDASGSAGVIVPGDPTDPEVFAAAQAAIVNFNEWKLVTGVKKGPMTVAVAGFIDPYQCHSIATGYLVIVSIEKVNVESLEPEIPGVYYYITLICRDDRGIDAKLQLKVFSGPSYYVKLFRRAPCMDMVNVSEPSSYQSLSQDVVQEPKPMLIVEA